MSALSFRVRRMGKLWEAYLKRPASDRPLFYVGATKYEAIGALLNGVAKMAREAPGRLWPQGN